MGDGSKGGGNMKVMTFNILTGGIDTYESRIEYIKKVISDASPDFVAVQEANNFDNANDTLLKEVSQHIALPYYALSPGSDLEGEHFNVASFSCYPFKEIHRFSGPLFQCAALLTVIDSSLGELAICNIQLGVETGHAEDDRLREIEAVLKHVAGYENQILLGDLNSISLDDDYELETLQVEPRFDVTNMLNQDYVDIASYLELDDKITHPTASNKHPDYTMPIRIDYIFVTPSLASRVKIATVIKTETSEQA